MVLFIFYKLLTLISGFILPPPASHCPIVTHEHILIPWAATVNGLSGFFLSFFFLFLRSDEFGRREGLFFLEPEDDIGGAFIRLGEMINKCVLRAGQGSLANVGDAQSAARN